MIILRYKVIIAIVIVLLIILAVFFTWQGIHYSKYQKYFDQAIQEYGESFLQPAQSLNLETKEFIPNYTKTDLGWISFETPFGSYTETEDNSNDLHYYKIGNNSKYLVIITSDHRDDDSLLYKKDYVETLRSNAIEVTNAKDFYDAILNRDYQSISLFSSTQNMKMYTDLLSIKLSTTKYQGPFYSFETNDYSGYILVDNPTIILVFDKNGKDICSISMRTPYSDTSSFTNVETISNIVSSLKVQKL